MKQDRPQNTAKAPSLLGFSLLEVMIALAILALSFTGLLLVQARATKMAIAAKEISLATQLARYQLMECSREVVKKIGAVTDYESQGDFAALGFEKITWECHAPRFNVKPPSESQIQDSVKKNAPVGEKAPATDSSMAAPIIGMITETLSNAVRELCVIIRWDVEPNQSELRVVTHVTDPTAMAGLARMISQSSSFTKNKGTQAPAPTPGGSLGQPPGPPMMMPPGPPPMGGGRP
jgi:prepilin-type N-terminal cleavage/methylation domain-containing protein